MQKLSILGFLIPILLSLGLGPLPAPTQVETPSQVIAAVNTFRTSNGLPALEVDYALMGAAQAHSDYQAAIGQVTHTGEGGTRPIDRAYAWGFGDGAQAFVSENIAGGYKVTIEIAIYDFWQDEWHLHTMLNPNAVYIGAGVATSGKSTYYTVDTGYYVGSRPKATAPNDGSTPGATGAPQLTSAAYDPFIISTPREDGAIIHVVGYGQTLIGIANTYGVELADLYRYNNYNQNTVIYPKEWVIIRPAEEASITETPSKVNLDSELATEEDAAIAATKTARPPRPTRTPRKAQSTVTRPEHPTPTQTAPPVMVSEGSEPLVVGIVIASLLVLLGVILYGLFNRN